LDDLTNRKGIRAGLSDSRRVARQEEPAPRATRPDERPGSASDRARAEISAAASDHANAEPSGMHGGVKRRAMGCLVALALVAAPGEARADEDKWLGTDKALHFEVSVALASGAYALSSLKIDGMAPRAAIAGGFSLAVGAGKELWDLSGHGDPSWKDFAWDAIGTAVGLGLAMTIDAITRGASRESTGVAGSGLVVRF
jgi:putative lipoprotein